MAVKVQSLGSAGSAAALLTVTGATNATPIVITLGAGHGLKDDDRLAIAGITGNTNANGVWSLQFTGTNTAILKESSGNGTFGGTVRAAIQFERTPFMYNHSNALSLFGNLVGTLDIEVYGSYADFAAGANTVGQIAPVMSGGDATNSAGSSSTPAKSTIVLTATNQCISVDSKSARYMRGVVTAYTSGNGGVRALG